MKAILSAAALALAVVSTGLTACETPANIQGRDVPNPPGTDVPNETPVDGAVSIRDLPGHEGLPLDRTHKEGPRVMPAEVYIRTYLQLFGGLTPTAVRTQAAADGLFDQWNDYVQALGLPDHRIDLARNTQQTMLSAATFERLAIALCDRAVLRDLRGAAAPEARLIFAFATPANVAAVDQATFTRHFDVLHKTFLGYPAALAPATRGPRYYQLFQQAAAAQMTARGAGSTPSFTPVEAGYAAVCYGLARHPEFIHY